MVGNTACHRPTVEETSRRKHATTDATPAVRARPRLHDAGRQVRECRHTLARRRRHPGRMKKAYGSASSPDGIIIIIAGESERPSRQRCMPVTTARVLPSSPPSRINGRCRPPGHRHAETNTLNYRHNCFTNTTIECADGVRVDVTTSLRLPPCQEFIPRRQQRRRYRGVRHAR